MNESALSAEGLLALNFEDIIKYVPGYTCLEFAQYFARFKDNECAISLYEICSYHFEPENKTPFSPMLKNQKKRTAIPEDISDADLEILEQYCPEVKFPELQARIADVLWVRKKGGIHFAWVAIEAYYQACQQLLAAGVTWVYAIERLERAVRLSVTFRRTEQGAKWLEKLTLFIVSEYERVKISPEDAYPLRLLRLAFNCNLTDDTYLADEMLFLAITYRNLSFRLALNAAEYAISVEISLNNKAQQHTIWRLIAEINQQEAACQESGLISAGCLQRAIEALAKVPGTRAERIMLYDEMREFQVQALNQLELLASHSQDISNLAYAATSAVKGVDLFDMIFRLALIINQPVNIIRLKEEAFKIQNNSISWLFGSTHIDHEGIPVASVPGDMGAESENAEALWALMMRGMKTEHDLAVKGQILPALEEITLKHSIDLEQLRNLFAYHPLIPTGHVEFFIKGLHYGFEGDYMVACHLLVPQIENSLRHLARLKGEEPTVLHGDGAQERSGLKGLLENPLIIKALGEDITVNLKAILTDKVYGDMRNQLSHGYMPAYHFNQSPGIYMWWLVLHILMLPFTDYWVENYSRKMPHKQMRTE